jgi:hypothetical protein
MGEVPSLANAVENRKGYAAPFAGHPGSVV